MDEILLRYCHKIDDITKTLDAIEVHEGDWFALKCAAFRLAREAAAKERQAAQEHSTAGLELRRLWIVSSIRQSHNLLEQTGNLTSEDWRAVQSCYLALAREAEQLAIRALRLSEGSSLEPRP